MPAGMKRFPLISCGMSAKDTVTFSSIREKDGIICLQRQINTFSGRIVEPQEYCFEPCGSESFPTLVVASSLRPHLINVKT